MSKMNAEASEASPAAAQSTHPYGTHLLHITSNELWNSALKSADGLYRAPSLSDPQQGFIHCSTPQQLFGTLNKWFKGTPEVLVLHFDLQSSEDSSSSTAQEGGQEAPHPRLEASLVRWEEVYPGQPPFPHLFGPIPTSVVTQVQRLKADPSTGLFSP